MCDFDTLLPSLLIISAEASAHHATTATDRRLLYHPIAELAWRVNPRGWSEVPFSAEGDSAAVLMFAV